MEALLVQALYLLSLNNKDTKAFYIFFNEIIGKTSYFQLKRHKQEMLFPYFVNFLMIKDDYLPNQSWALTKRFS